MEYIKEQNHLKNYFQLLKNFFASSKIVQFIADTRLRRVIRGASPSKYNALIKLLLRVPFSVIFWILYLWWLVFALKSSYPMSHR